MKATVFVAAALIIAAVVGSAVYIVQARRSDERTEKDRVIQAERRRIESEGAEAIRELNKLARLAIADYNSAIRPENKARAAGRFAELCQAGATVPFPAPLHPDSAAEETGRRADALKFDEKRVAVARSLVELEDAQPVIDAQTDRAFVHVVGRVKNCSPGLLRNAKLRVLFRDGADSRWVYLLALSTELNSKKPGEGPLQPGSSRAFVTEAAEVPLGWLGGKNVIDVVEAF